MTDILDKKNETSPTPPFDPAREMLELLTEIARLRHQVKQGVEVNISGLYERVDILCQILTTLPPIEARRHAAGIGQAVAALDSMEDIIASRFKLDSPRNGPRGKLPESL